MPRFVILQHDWPSLHWDLLLEAGPVLKAWRLPVEPGSGSSIPVEPNFDHRRLYLDYEGPISGNRGHVRRWDDGHYETETCGNAVLLHGSRWYGRLQMETNLLITLR